MYSCINFCIYLLVCLLNLCVSDFTTHAMVLQTRVKLLVRVELVYWVELFQTTPTQSKMAPSLMRGIQLKIVFVVVTYTVMCYIQLVAGQGSSLSYLDPSITLDTALFTMDFETSSVDLLEPSSTSSAPTT